MISGYLESLLEIVVSVVQILVSAPSKFTVLSYLELLLLTSLKGSVIFCSLFPQMAITEAVGTN